MKNTVTFFSFKPDQRQLLSKAKFDRIINEREEYNQHVNKDDKKTLQLKLKGLEKSLSKHKELSPEEEGLINSFEIAEGKIRSIEEKIGYKKNQISQETHVLKEESRKLMLTELSELEKEQVRILSKQKKFSPEDKVLFEKLKKAQKEIRSINWEIDRTKRDIKRCEEESLNLRNKVKSIPPRIPTDEIENLNTHIKEMNDKGWSIQTIQSIETGVYDFAYENGSRSGDGGWGYGYGASFTEGVMLYWEKD